MTKKIIALGTGVLMMLCLAVIAVPAQAQVVTTSAVFTRDLTIGSTGQDVSALQSFLVSKGFLVIPAGVAPGYFGNLTQTALGRYQASVGISPTAGYFGPITRSQINALAMGGSTVSGCIPGAVFSSTTGQACTTTTSSVAGCVPGSIFSSTTGQRCDSTSTSNTTGITTPGAEGNIIVTKESSGVNSTVYEGNSRVPVLGFKVQANQSDVLVQRVKVDLGTSTNAYVKVFQRLYLTDASGAVLATTDLNSSTVSREGSSPARYTVTFSGFNSLVRKDSRQSFYVKADIYPSISSEYRDSQLVSLAGTDTAVRAVDGAGIDEYDGGTDVSQNVSISRSLSDTATLTLSTDPDTLKSQTLVANSGSASNETDKVTVASFRAFAERDNVLVRDLSITASSTTGGAYEPTAYLYDGSNQIASASGSTNGTSTVYAFTSIDQTVSLNSTRTYTIKVDVRNASTVAETFKITRVDVLAAESGSTGSSVSVSPITTVGNDISFVSQGTGTSQAGSNLNIVSTKDQNGNTTEVHLTSTFNVAINAIGADAVFGAPATSTFNFKIFRNGIDVTSTLAPYFTVYYPSTQPSGTTAYNSATGFTVPRNGNATVPVSFRVDVVGAGTVASVFPSGDYTVRLNNINYTVNGTAVSNDNSTNSAWVTNTAQRP